MKKIYFKKIPWNKIPFIDFFLILFLDQITTFGI